MSADESIAVASPPEPTVEVTRPSSSDNLMRGHVVALDGVRGLAILMVMITHQGTEAKTAAAQFLGRFLAFGGSGVCLFFVLSGYLITGILLASKGARNYYRNFYVRRFLRIFPLYYLVLFLAFYVMLRLVPSRAEKWGHISGLDRLWYWSYLSNWYISLNGLGIRHGMVDLSWSLSIEEQFYLVWPLVVALCTRGQLMRVCGVLIAMAPSCRLAVLALGLPEIGTTMLTPSQFDALGVGAALAIMAAGGGLSRLARWAAPVAVFGGLAVIVIQCVVVPAFLLRRPWLVISGTALSLVYGAVVTTAATAHPGSITNRIFANRLMVILGTYSYALYLFHNPIQRAMRDRVISPEQLDEMGLGVVGGQVVFCVLATLPALACAWISWHVFEGPILSLKRYFPSGRSTVRAEEA
jgi:peptidoglycan/LPS O-acetylase OafA/YrhL